MPQPDILTIHIDFVSEEGVFHFISAKLGSFRTARRRLASARSEVLPQGNLYAASGDFADGKIAAKCRGNKGEVYEMQAEFESQMGEHIDWSHAQCSCIRCAQRVLGRAGCPPLCAFRQTLLTCCTSRQTLLTCCTFT